MAVCISCNKQTITRHWSRHKKGSAGGISGPWSLKAQVVSKPQSPNLHTFKGKKYCTKCLRIAKAAHRHSQTQTSVSV